MDEFFAIVAETISSAVDAVAEFATALLDPDEATAIPMPPVGGWAAFDRKAA